MTRLLTAYCIARGLVATAFAAGSAYAAVYGTGNAAFWLAVAAFFAMPSLSTEESE